MSALPEYEVYAIVYAQREARRHHHFQLGDPHDGPMDMDYVVWALKGPDRSLMVDIGFSAPTAQKRNRDWQRCPVAALAEVGIDPAAVRDVAITHLHYDHAGNFGLLPNARFHIQEPELHFAVGRQMKHAFFRQVYEVDDLCDVVRLNHAGRVVLHEGRADIAPGISVEPAPGHTPGQQVVRVHTRRGWIVLASDASHYYENIRNSRPFALLADVPAYMESAERIKAMAGGMDRLIPGHDPLVMKIYPPARPELAGIVARLDAEPDMAAFEAHFASIGR